MRIRPKVRLAIMPDRHTSTTNAEANKTPTMSPCKIADGRLEGSRRIYEEATDTEITLSEARAMGQCLITEFNFLGRPLPGDASSFSSVDCPGEVGQ